ncbi:hypothetical protein SVAN01_07650 [Stagonosporopsis vannaccii]|nr:hypothetical protein SVAN01_07650 [Stagonosporopsis vannaccii]
MGPGKELVVASLAVQLGSGSCEGAGGEKGAGRLGETTTQRQRGAGLVDVAAEVWGDVRGSHRGAPNFERPALAALDRRPVRRRVFELDAHVKRPHALVMPSRAPRRNRQKRPCLQPVRRPAPERHHGLADVEIPARQSLS